MYVDLAALEPFHKRNANWITVPGPRIVFLELNNTKKHYCSRVWSDKICDAVGNADFYDLDNHPDVEESGQCRIGPNVCRGFRSQSDIPLMYACKESYNIGRKFYTKAFGTRGTFPDTWFNFETDILYLDYAYKKQQSPKEDFDLCELSTDIERVQNLALYYHPPSSRPYRRRLTHLNPLSRETLTPKDVASVLDHLKRVQNLYMVARSHKLEERAADLCFLDIGDVAENHSYRNYEDQDGYHYLAYDEFSDSISRIDYLDWVAPKSAFDSRALDTLRRKQLGPNKLPLWMMPKIEIKLVTTSERKALYLSKKKAEDERRATTLVKVLLGSPGYLSLEIEVHEVISFSDLEQMFRQARNIPADAKLNCFKCLGDDHDYKNASNLLRTYLSADRLRFELLFNDWVDYTYGKNEWIGEPFYSLVFRNTWSRNPFGPSHLTWEDLEPLGCLEDVVLEEAQHEEYDC